MKRTISLLLAVATALSLSLTATASGGFDNFTKERTYRSGIFSDITSSAWYADSVQTAYELGLMNGTGGQFNPNGNLTVAEALALAGRIRSIYSTGEANFSEGNPWYQVYVDYAISNGIIRNDEYVNYGAPATRAQFASIMYSALPAEAWEPINSISTLPDVDSGAEYAPAVFALYNAGVLTGNDAFGTFAPDSNIQRSAVATIIMRMAAPVMRKPLTLKEKLAGSASTANVQQVMIDKEYGYIGEGETITLHASTIPAVANPSIVWESSSPDFVAIDSTGKVSVVKTGAGKVKITATADSGAKAECYILMKSPDIVTRKAGTGYVYSEHTSVPSFDSVVAGVPLWLYHRIDYTDLGVPITDCYSYLTNTLEESEAAAQKYAKYLKAQGFILLQEEDDPVAIQSVGSDIVYTLMAPNRLTVVEIKGELAAVGTPYITPEVSIKIKEDGATAVTGIKVSQSTLAMTTGETATISSLLSPEKPSFNNTNWSSSDSGVVVIDSLSSGPWARNRFCTLKAVGVGTATITARSSNGLTATCTVTVTGDTPVYATATEIPAQAGASSAKLSAEQIYSKCSPAVFYIEVYNSRGLPVSTGSGFFISKDGTAVTNYHVTEGASALKIYLPDGRTYWVDSIVSASAAKDIAIIKVKGSNFPYLEIGDSDTVRGGQAIFAIGSPLGLSNTISDGIVSNPSRSISGLNYIQISAPISHGSSGGALLNQAGQVIGITSAGFDDGQNLNLAIPINLIYTIR